MFDRTWAKDAAERIIATFVAAFVGVVIAAGPADLFSVSTAKAAAAAGIVAVLTAVKTVVAARIPGTISPASVAD